MCYTSVIVIGFIYALHLWKRDEKNYRAPSRQLALCFQLHLWCANTPQTSTDPTGRPSRPSPFGEAKEWGSVRVLRAVGCGRSTLCLALVLAWWLAWGV